MPQSLTEHAEIEPSFRQGFTIFTREDTHFFTITKYLLSFRMNIPGLPTMAAAAWSHYPGTTPPGGPVHE
jgi:hypothetical protein